MSIWFYVIYSVSSDPAFQVLTGLIRVSGVSHGVYLTAVLILTIASRAVCDARLPLSQPLQGVDGTVMNEVVVPKGTRISVGVYSSNRNKAIWGEYALEWKPERWINPLPSSVNDAKIPGVYANL